MSVSILNTDANLTGKTVVTLETSETVTGLKTFDRDPNPPFAVTSGSAAVTNLDADKLDGQEGTYYTSATNLSSGTLAQARFATTQTLTDGATPALDASLGSVFRLSAAGDRTIAVPSNATSGQKIVIQHFASGGARTLALNSGAGGFRFGTDVTALTQTTSGKTDYIGCVYNATDSKWDVVAYVKGY
jgi:hypothetical protein